MPPASATVLDVGVAAHARRQAGVLPAAPDEVEVRLGAAAAATAAASVPGARTSADLQIFHCC